MNSTARGPTITLTNTSQYLQQQPAATQNNIKLEELHAQCEQSNTFEPVQQNSQNHNHEMANISRLTTNAGHQNQANQMNTHLNTQTTNSTGPKPRGRRKKIRTEPIRPICPQCEKQFSNQSALTKHKLTHSDERKFACQQCSKAFKRHDHLTGHMQTHSNRKPFNCTIQGCDKTYCDARSLRRHKENIHHIVTPKEDHNHQQQQQHCTNNLNNGLSNNTLHQQPVKLADQHTNTNQLHYLDQSQMNGTTTGLHQAVEQQQQQHHHHQQLDENNNNNNTINNNSSCSSTSSSTNNANSNNNNNNHIDSSPSHIHHLNHQQTTANHYNALNNNNLQNIHQVAQVQQHQPGTHVISSTSTLNDLDNSNAANCHAQLQSLQPLEDQSRWTNINHPPAPQIAPGNNTFQQPHQHQQHHHSHHHQQQQQQIHHHPQASYSADYASTQHFSFDFTHPLEQLDQSNTISHSADSVPIPHSADSVRYGAHSVMANNSSQVHQHQPTQATYISAPTQQPSHLLRRRIQRFHSDRGSYGAGEEPRSEHAGRLDLIQRPMDPLQEQQQVSYSADYASTQHFFELNHTISTTTTSHQPHSADSITDSGLGLNVQYERQMTPTYTSSNNTHQYHLQQASFSADYASTQHFSFDFPNDNQYYN